MTSTYQMLRTSAKVGRDGRQEHGTTRPRSGNWMQGQSQRLLLARGLRRDLYRPHAPRHVRAPDRGPRCRGHRPPERRAEKWFKADAPWPDTDLDGLDEILVTSPGPARPS